ncbi:MAG: hypothetical protein M1819_000054 [Sarea resinae]|nr:MAG: hypothetical protein M1819_000054 [Sarea resinae]
MSSNAAPISPAAFATAIQDLPLSNLHNKASELRNSIAHLHSSNLQLRPYADEGDQDCLDAVRENEEVIQRMVGRIALLRREVEKRGFRWDDAEVEEKESRNGDIEMANGVADESGEGRASQTQQPREGGPERRPGGSLTDEELARRLREQMDEDGEDGVHL